MLGLATNTTAQSQRITLMWQIAPPTSTSHEVPRVPPRDAPLRHLIPMVVGGVSW